MFLRKILKCLFISTLLYTLNLVQSSHQDGELDTRFNSNPKDNDISKHQDAYKVPFVLLMSSDSISVAQLPLIENGTVTVVYRLIGKNNDNVDVREIENINDSEEEEEENQCREQEDIGDKQQDADDEEEKEVSPRRAESGPDVREYEQMPSEAISATITPAGASLGKSEWQQIATGVRNREETQPSQTTASTSRKEDDAQATEGGLPRRRRRRAKRSNSFLSLTDDEGNNNSRASTNSSGVEGTSEETQKNEIQQQQQQQQQHQQGQQQSAQFSRQDEQTEPKSTNSKTSVEESSSNVTSAQFATDNQQPNLTATERATAEEGDKNSQTQSGHDGLPSSSSSSPSPSSSSRCSSQAASHYAAGSDGLKFSDFDVHMSLGYAFVADSTGRIHRFRLLRESSSSSATAAATSPETTTSHTNGDDLLENDYTNTIEAGSKFEFLPQQSRISGVKKQPTTTRLTSPNTASADDVVGSGNVRDEASSPSSSDAHNKVSAIVGRSDGVTIHEQSGDQRQHPAVSGAGDHQQQLTTADSDRLLSDAPISASPRTSLNQQLASNSRLEYIDGAEPSIIWSRNKFRSPLAAVRGRSSAGANAAAAAGDGNAKGALPAQVDEHQVANEARTSHRIAFDGPKQSQRVRDTAGHQPVGESKAELNGPTSNGSGVHHAKRRYLPTEIAVDWLNNLLFVLDKYRLLVVDFDGNNELVLIDDFNQNNRPIDIKVDPINDFLFWLQVGKFHNTIYKLNLNVLSERSARQRLVGNTLKLRQSGRIKQVVSSKRNQSEERGENGGSSFDTSDLIALVSHHYAHPIITNLPRHTRLFTIDHKHSRIYVPLGPSPPTSVNISGDGTSQIQPQRDDAEIFAPSDNVTHLNNTADHLNPFEEGDKQNCTTTATANKQLEAGSYGQILAYNLDGTDVGPLRSIGDKSHIKSLEDMQDFTVDTEKNLLYWLTNKGRDLFEEYWEGATRQPAQHDLDDRSYLKLMHFDNDGSNQPTNKKSRFNMRELLHMLSNSIQPNRQTRGSEDGGFPTIMSSRHRADSDTDSTRFSRNAPFIILGVTCLLVVTVYLVYALIFQRVAVSSHGSIGGGSSMSGSHASPGSDAGTMFNTSTVSRWIVGPPRGGLHASTMNRVDLNSGRVESCDLESTNYDASNAIDEHYRDGTINHSHQVQDDFFGNPESSARLANLSQWPSNMHDMSNKLYVPVEIQQDEALSAINRISIDELEIERKAPLGEGHFGTVLQGTIRWSVTERTNPTINKQQACYMPMSPDSLTLPNQPHRAARLPISSTGSSGHGSSSSTSYEFRTANNCTDATTSTNNNGDYLTPKGNFNSALSDYTGENPESSEAESFSSYGLIQKDAKTAETKLRVAIKKLKDNPSRDEKRDFLQEAKLLADFDHPNIVHLIGICLDRGSTLIVMELMLGGDLTRYMQENIPSVNSHADNLTYDDLLKICLDIVNGCCYLEELAYIHRDLAARNCLVSSRKREERVVKLADFGLARDIYKDSYYKKLNDSAMPLKWMAPECLIEQRFTKKSDVWSFGVVMWEVMSYCQEKPYVNVEPFLIKEHLASGARLRKPDCCDEDMYRLMNQCWQLEPANRPTFHECRAMLIEIRNGR